MAILYANIDRVRTLLSPKVRIDEAGTDTNKLSLDLLKIMIEQAEGDLEIDLSPRYAVPFQTMDGKAFKVLPDRPTKQVVAKLAELRSVMRVLETDFGRGAAVGGDKYYEGTKKMYDELMGKLCGRRKDSSGNEMYNQWMYPPLPNLMKAYFNTESDDGFAGSILTTSSGDGGFPAEQINNPGQNFWNGEIDSDESRTGRGNNELAGV